MEISEIKKHIEQVGYTEETQRLIAAYLYGVGEIETLDALGEILPMGDNPLSTFTEWYEQNDDPLFRSVKIRNIEGDEMTVPLTLIANILVENGFTVTHPDDGQDEEEQLTEDALSQAHQQGIVVNAYVPAIGGNTVVVACPNCCAEALRCAGYEVVEPTNTKQ
jgi:hypothetical protein